ncbi:unnamed protein product [Arabidopsis halleri]
MWLSSKIRRLHFLCFLQRERDRERVAARAGGKGKNGDDVLTPEQCREEMEKHCKRRLLKLHLRVRVEELEAKSTYS